MSELPSYLASVAKTIDHMIDRYFVDKTGELNKAAAHLLAAGGKRLRPAVLMLAADAVKPGSSDDELLHAALALEVTHTFTLIHDDIMDEDACGGVSRRSTPNGICRRHPCRGCPVLPRLRAYLHDERERR